MSQSQLAESIGASVSAVSKWEQGELVPRMPAAILALVDTLSPLPKGEGRYGSKGGRPRKEG